MNDEDHASADGGERLLAEVATVEADILQDRLTLAGIFGETLQMLHEELQRIKVQLAAMASSCTEPPERFVVNEDSKVVHLPTACLGPTGSWSTKCGWAFAKAKAAALRPDPDPTWPRCATCFKGVGADAASE